MKQIKIYDGLRLGIQFQWNQRGDEFLRTLSAVSGVDWRKIKRFMDGDDDVLTAIERKSLEILQ